MKKFRVIISILIFFLFSAAFLNFGKDWLLLQKIIKETQLIPSVMNLMYNLSSTAFLSVAVILFVTFISGRTYCSFFCPLGVLQDIFSFLSKKSFRKQKFSYSYKSHFRYYFTGIIILSVLAGTLIPLNLSDPYSIFGRIFSDIMRPIAVIGFNSIIDLSASVKIIIMTKQKINEIIPYSLIVSAIYFIAIFVLAAAKGRAFCNMFCPTGTLLSVISKHSIYRIYINDKCVMCGQCEIVCKSQCIDYKNSAIDFENCVMCLNCLKSCSEKAIEYKHRTSRINSPNMKKDKFSRKAALKWIFSLTGFAAFGTLLQSLKFVNLLTNHSEAAETMPVPPGCVSVEHLRSRCTSCHLCVSVCPTNIIVPSAAPDGFKGIFQPVLNFKNGYCTYECTRCSQVCPAGAILPLSLEEKKITSIGEVQLKIEKCIVTLQKTDCGACAEHCPTGSVFMKEKNGLHYPVTDSSKCVGCGACTYVCPSEPLAISVMARGIHTSLKPFTSDGIEKTEKQNEFNF